MEPDFVFDDLDLREMNVSDKGSMYFIDAEVEHRFDRLLEINCPMKNCGKKFPSVVTYKNHIKREHKKYVW